MLKTKVAEKQRLFIDGEWFEAREYAPLYSPYDGEIITHIPMASEAEAEMAIQSAVKAQTSMRKLASYERSEILYNLTNLLKENFDRAAELISIEAAKPIATAREEVKRTIQTYRFSAQEANQLYGETLPMDAAPGGTGRIGYTKMEPLGVIGAITPFNFPMNLVAHKVGPAIATGNTVVLKPASQTPLSSLFLVELLQKAGLPKGAINVITGRGKTVGDYMVKHDNVKMITFTGSPEVGKQIREKAGLKKIVLELGSNSALIVDQDTDIEQVVSRCVQGAFSYQGQVCISLQRIYVHENLYESFVEQFVKETRKLKTGDPLDEQTNVSALITSNDVERALSWIDEARNSGAKICLGGTSKGNVLLPTVITNASPDLKVSCQEVFAPIVVINSFSTLDEAISEVNNSRYGLQAGIYTKDIRKAIYSTEQLEVGGVIINDIPTFRVDHMPYGGVKESGIGKEGIKYAVEEMTVQKLVVINNSIQ